MICSDCHSEMYRKRERRENGTLETLYYCDSCGNCEVEK
jgi:hypothetical protein